MVTRLLTPIRRSQGFTLAGCILVGCVVSSIGKPCFAAQDPFGDAVPAAGGDDAFGMPDNNTPAAAKPTGNNKTESLKPLPPTDHPVIRAIREQPPRTPGEIAKAILYLSRLRQWDELSRYIGDWSKQPMTPTIASQMSAEIGLENLLAVRNAGSNLPAANQKWLEDIVRLSSEAGLDPSILKQYWKLLQSDKPVEQKRGIMGFESTGPTGLAYMLNAVVTDPAAPTPAMSVALARFGETGTKAWQAAAQTKNPQAREKLVRVLHSGRTRDHISDLLAIVYSSSDTAAAKQIATNLIHQEYQTVPSPTESLDYLKRQLQSKLELLNARREEESQPSREVWFLDAKSLLLSGLQSMEAAHLESCRQSATKLARVASAVDVEVPVAAATLLENALRDQPSIYVESPVAGIANDFPQSSITNPDFMIEVSRVSRQYGLAGGELRAIQQLGNLLSDSEATVDQLDCWRKGLESGVPAIRFAAAEAITLQKDPHPFAGSNLAFETLVEMVALEGEPLSLIVGHAEDLKSHTSQLLRQLGHRSESVGSSREAIRWLDRPNPVESILIVDKTSDMNLAELVQRLRSHRRGAGIPIAILVEELSPGQSIILSEERNLIRTYVPSNADGMHEIIQKFHRGNSRLSMSTSDRVGWRAVAEGFMRKTKADARFTSVYPTARWARHLEDRMGSLVQDESTEKLKKIGTRASQLELSRRASQASVDGSQRKGAVESLVQSIQTHGLKLAQEDVRAIYDAYNEQGRTNSQARDLLGSLLDTIEANSH